MSRDKITRGTKNLIDIVINKNNINIDSENLDKSELCNQICIEIEQKYPGKSLDYNLHRMKLEKVNDIKKAVDIYLLQYQCNRKRLKKKG